MSASASAKNMVVAVRVRPLSAREISAGCKNCCTLLSEKLVVISKEQQAKYLRSQKGSMNEYAFDHAFDENSTQQAIYEETTKPFMRKLVDGYNVTVFAYGATGSGKTHTMMGNTRHDESSINAEAGIIPNALQDVFHIIDQEKQKDSIGVKWSVGVTFIEVYNEQVYDLLQPMGKCLPLREDKVKGVVEIAGVAEKAVGNPAEVLDLLQQGNRHRKTEATMANQVSSRSHAVLQLMVRRSKTTSSGREAVTESKLSLIDLAGSERASATQNRGARLNEGANINKSLLALANCINALSEKSGKKPSSVKFRDSKLTHLLRSSLEGNCSLIMIANINPSDKTFEDSHNTLKYANRAKNIKVDPTVTDHVKESNWMERETRLREENEMLRNQVLELQKKMTLFNQDSVSTADFKLLGNFTPSTMHESVQMLPALRSAQHYGQYEHSAGGDDMEVDETVESASSHKTAWREGRAVAPMPQSNPAAFHRKSHMLKSSAVVSSEEYDGMAELEINLRKESKTPKSARKRSKRNQGHAADVDKSLFTLGAAFTIANANDESHELLDTTAAGRDALLPKYSIRITADAHGCVSPVTSNQEEPSIPHRRSARKKPSSQQQDGQLGLDTLPRSSIRIAPDMCASPQLKTPATTGSRCSARKRARLEENDINENGLNDIMMSADLMEVCVEEILDEEPLKIYKKRRGSGIPLRTSGTSSTGALPTSSSKESRQQRGPETETAEESFMLGSDSLVPLHSAKYSKPTIFSAASDYCKRSAAMVSRKVINDENIQKGSSKSSLFIKSGKSGVDKNNDFETVPVKGSATKRAPFGTILNNKLRNVQRRTSEISPL